MIGVCQASVTTSSSAGGPASASCSAPASRPGSLTRAAVQPETPGHVIERHVGEVVVLPAAAEGDPAVPADPAEERLFSTTTVTGQAEFGHRGQFAGRVAQRAVAGQHDGAVARRAVATPMAAGSA